MPFFRPRHLSASSVFFALFAALTAAIAAETVSMPQSDEADAGSWAKREEYVVVTATREPESVANILVPITVIDRDDIDRSLAIDVAQLLGQQAGIDGDRRLTRSLTKRRGRHVTIVVRHRRNPRGCRTR